LDIWYPIVTHGCKLQCPDTAKISKVLGIIINSSWYVTMHPNNLAANLMKAEGMTRLKRKGPTDLSN